MLASWPRGVKCPQIPEWVSILNGIRTCGTLGQHPVVQPHSLSRLAALRIALPLRCQLVEERRQALPCRIGMPVLVAEVQVYSFSRNSTEGGF